MKSALGNTHEPTQGTSTLVRHTLRAEQSGHYNDGA